VYATFLYGVGIVAEVISYFAVSTVYSLQYGEAAQLHYILPVARTVSNVIFVPLMLGSIILFRKLFFGKVEHRQLNIPIKYTIAFLVVLQGIVLQNSLLVIATVPQMLATVPELIISHIITAIMLLLVIWIYNTVLIHLEEFEKSLAKDQMLERWEVQYQATVSSQKLISKLKHDMKYNHLTTLSLLNEGSYDEAKKHIESGLGSFSPIINTGNMAIDVMLNYYNQKAIDELGIRLEMELSIPPRMKVDANIIAIILGNALENASNACERVEAEKRYINVKISYLPHGELIIIITNPYAIAPIVDEFGELQTTKNDKNKHGLGIVNMREILPKEQGRIHFEYEENTFKFILLLNYKHL